MRYIFFISFITLFFQTKTFAQIIVEPSPIKWYSIEEAEELNKKQPRTLLIDFYTDWCGWCTHMMKTTFANPGLAAYINNNFYPVRFNAETKDSIMYRDTMYYNTGTGNKPTHNLAKKLLDGRLSYPTIVYIDTDNRKLAVPGYMETKKIEPILIYFTESINNSMSASLDDFMKYFELSFYPDSTLILKDSTKVNWITFSEALEKNKKNPKKIFVDIYIPWYVNSKVMNKTTYHNPVIAKYLNDNYYAVRFDATSHDTINYSGYTFINPTTAPSSLHQLAGAFLQNSFIFPTTLVLDEESKMVNKVQGYLPPLTLEPMLHFFIENAYKSTPWEKYITTFKSEISKTD